MSLDDLIAKNAHKSKNNGNATSASNKQKFGGVRANNKKQSLRSAPYEPQNTKRSKVNTVEIVQPVEVKSQLSVFSRLKKPVSGTQVTFRGLLNTVEENDVNELCSSFGDIKEIDFSVGNDGKRTALVLFDRRTSAMTCVSELNG